MSKPVLYTFHLSVWSAAADLARIELGLVDKIDAKSVNVMEAETVSPDYLKINPAGTVPALTAGGKLYGDTTTTIEYMVNVSSVKVAGRTSLTKAVHDDSIDPNFMLRSARNEADIERKASGKAGIASRLAKIKEHAEAPSATPFQALFDRRIATFATMYAIFDGQASDADKRAFFEVSQANYDGAREFVLNALPAAIVDGPFVAGAVPGEDDFHVGAWLFRAARSGGATMQSDGIAAFERWFDAPVPEKVKALWDAWVVRESWKAVYPDGVLH